MKFKGRQMAFKEAGLKKMTGLLMPFVEGKLATIDRMPAFDGTVDQPAFTPQGEIWIAMQDAEDLDQHIIKLSPNGDMRVFDIDGALDSTVSSFTATPAKIIFALTRNRADP